ncbi:TAXI family TRAP transporter solute-binding subunit [Sulfitobacter sp. D35]|uniref:TAXI family TRAP transporter solute-binding subunit n=1 Tax=Sulfitobacter sp. D35 TaxID=3083252 RepID=UPI00296FF5BB|nr:TAXI family TRAP transporter solute-binding subunit [Sulfitobacter sp. D35]MDW4499027.1 TAXI family TRAP transporter solute-binding subunit [Sulfitobacter sp. D35]
MSRRLPEQTPIYLAIVVLLALVAGLVWVFVDKVLLPPDRVTLAAGREGGGYYAFARRYQAILAVDDIELEIVETAGAVENARLLTDGDADVGFIQGGISFGEDAEVVALASVFLEPLLIVHRAGLDGSADPTRWDRLRIAAGEPESGTRAAIRTIVARLGMEVDLDRIEPLGGPEAAEALKSGEIDVAVFVASIDAPYLQDLLTDPGFTIHPIRDAEAIARRLPFVRIADIPRAGLDYAGALPPERITLTAMVASLVAHDGLHPAIVNRLVRAAQKVHGRPSILSDMIDFPSAEHLDLPLDSQAAAVLEKGESPLEAVLPYWVAAQITRVTIFLVPLIILLLPVLRATPGLVEWRLRSRVYRNYNRLVRIEQEAASGEMTQARRAELARDLDDIDQAIANLNLPPRYREYAYSMRMHIDLVRGHLA